MTPIGQRIGRAYRKLRWSRLRGGPGRTPRILTVPTANGLLSFSNMDVHNARTLYVHRAWEPELITSSMEYLKREGFVGKPGADVLVDVGANIGMICIGMLRQGHFREAIAVEPNPQNFTLLTRNIEQNGLQGRIRAFPYAIADASGEVEMELSEENFGDHRVRATRSIGPALMREEGRRTARVAARTLDETITREAALDPSRIGLVWADIQGFEGQLIRGARTVFAAGAPLLSEFWPYGIQRAGIGRDEYASIVRSSFARIVIVNAASGTFEMREAAAIGDLFEAYPRPEHQLEIIFLSH